MQVEASDDNTVRNCWWLELKSPSTFDLAWSVSVCRNQPSGVMEAFKTWKYVLSSFLLRTCGAYNYETDTYEDRVDRTGISERIKRHFFFDGLSPDTAALVRRLCYFYGGDDYASMMAVLERHVIIVAAMLREEEGAEKNILSPNNL